MSARRSRLVLALALAAPLAPARPARAQEQGQPVPAEQAVQTGAVEQSAPQPPAKLIASFNVGLGYANMSARSGAIPAAFSGPALDVSILLGGRVSRRVGLFGEAGAGGIMRTSYSTTGTDQVIDNANWVDNRVSAGVIYWIEPINLQVAAAVSYAKYGVLEDDTRVALAESKFGPGAFVEVRRHGSAALGLEGALRISYGQAQQLDRTFDWKTTMVTLVLAAGYSPFRRELPPSPEIPPPPPPPPPPEPLAPTGTGPAPAVPGPAPATNYRSAVIGAAPAEIHTAPHRVAPIVERFNPGQPIEIGDVAAPGWRLCRLPDGRIGYVEEAALRP